MPANTSSLYVFSLLIETNQVAWLPWWSILRLIVCLFLFPLCCMALEHRVDDTLVWMLYLPDILGVNPGPMGIL